MSWGLRCVFGVNVVDFYLALAIGNVDVPQHDDGLSFVRCSFR